MTNFQEWESTIAEAVAAHETEQQRLDEAKAKLYEHAKKIREQHAVEINELQGRINTLNLIVKTAGNANKLAGLDRDVLTQLWDRNDTIKTSFSVDQQNTLGQIMKTMLAEAEALMIQKEAQPMKVGGAESASSNSTAPGQTVAQRLATTSVEDLPTAEEQAAKELELAHGAPKPPIKPPIVDLGKRNTPDKPNDDEMDAEEANQAAKLAKK